jgi:hypothetical protein
MEDRLYGAISLWNHAICASPTKRKRTTDMVRRERKRQYLLDDVESDEKCQPWNREMFFERVSTFSVSKWFAKPECIGPLECARQGWICRDVDTIECRCCVARLCFKIEDGSEEKSIGKAFHEQLLKGHKDLCPWRNSPSPMSFTTIPRISESLRASYRSRVNTFAGDLKLNVPAETLTKVEGLCGNRPEKLKSTQVVAIFGWSFKRSLICCDFCNRKVESSSSSSSSSSSEVFDPMLEHRWWCPWIRTRRSKAGDSSIEGAGWESTAAAVFESVGIGLRRTRVSVEEEEEEDDEEQKLSQEEERLQSPEVRVKRLRRLLQGSVGGGDVGESKQG